MSVTQPSQDDTPINDLIDRALKEGDEPRRPAEAVRLLIDLWASRVDQIFGLIEQNPLFTQEIQALIPEIRRLMTLDTPDLAQEIQKKEWFERTKRLNALPLEHLIRVHNYLRRVGNDALRNEVNNAINRDSSYTKRVKHVNTRVIEYIWDRLPNWITETGIKSSYDIEEI